MADILTDTRLDVLRRAVDMLPDSTRAELRALITDYKRLREQDFENTSIINDQADEIERLTRDSPTVGELVAAYKALRDDNRRLRKELESIRHAADVALDDRDEPDDEPADEPRHNLLGGAGGDDQGVYLGPGDPRDPFDDPAPK